MDDFESRLTATLSDRARETNAPPIDAQALLRTGQREVHRRRVRASVLCAASVVAVALVVSGLVAGIGRSTEGQQPAHRGTGPTLHTPTRVRTLGDLPRGAPPALPYWLRGRLYLGDRTVAMPAPVIVSSGGATLVAERTREGLYRVFVEQDHRLHFLQQAATVPVVSPSGRYAAWETPLAVGSAGPMRMALALWSLTAGREVRSVEFVSHARCCDAPSEPVGVDDVGDVFVDDGGVPLVWPTAAHGVRRIIGVGRGDVLSDGFPAGAVFAETAKQTSESVYGKVDDSGRFHPIHTFASQEGSWSPGSDNAYVAYLAEVDTASGRLVPPYVLNTTTGQVLRLDLPLGHYTLSAWESASAVLLSGDDGRRVDWLRCDASSGECEVAQVFDDTGPDSLVLPQDG